MLVPILIIIILLVALALRIAQRPRNFPPGPKGIPFFGYIPMLNGLDPTYPHKGMEMMAAKYGPVVGFYLGHSQPVISVCGFDAVREALMNDSFNSRPFTTSLKDRTSGKVTGLMFTDGDLFVDQRRFTLRHLRDLGLVKSSMEDTIRQEIRELLADIHAEADSNPSGLVDFQSRFKIPVINILWVLVAGKRFQRNDVQLARLIKSLESMFQGGNMLVGAASIPSFLFRLFPALQKPFGVHKSMLEDIEHFIQMTISQHRKDRIGDAPRDFIDVYLQEMSRTNDPTFNNDQLVGIIIDLFSAGSDSISNTIGFALLHLLHHPEIQQKVQAELDLVCGSTLPTLGHRPHLVYTDAVLMEAQRMSAIAPLTVPHFATKDARLRSYFIPKGSILNINIHSVHYDPDYWIDPDHFIPERHIDKDGKLIKTDHFMPFGIGKRSCLGESLARNIYFLFVASVVKSFELEPASDEPAPTLDPVGGFILVYDGFKAVLHPRH